MRHFLSTLRDKNTPGHQPHDQQRPKQQQRNGVVVAWNALVQETQKMLIDEVEPQKPADLTLCGIGALRQNVPRSGDCEKNQRTRGQTQVEQMLQISG